MNNESIFGKLTRFGVWVFIVAIVMSIVGILIAPLALPSVRNSLNHKYDGFVYKNDLVNEEMKIYTKIVWSVCIMGWFLFSTYVLVVGL